MSQRFQRPFYTVTSTEPAFNSTLGSANTAYALESSDTNRIWQGPSNRTVRVASKASDDLFMVFGTTTAVATSSGGMLILGGTVEAFYVSPSQTNVAVASSTDVEVNVTIGYGG